MAPTRRLRAARAAIVAAAQVFSEPLMLALPSAYPSAALSARQGTVAVRCGARAHHAGGCGPCLAQEVIQLQTIVGLASAGMGVAWVSAAMTQLQRPGLAYRRVDRKAAQAHTSLLWRGDSPMVQRFVLHVRAQPEEQRQSAALDGEGSR